MNEALIHFTGVNGATGQPLMPPLCVEELAAYIAEEDKQMSKTKRNRRHRLYEMSNDETLGVREGYNAECISDVGWGVIYHENTPQEVRNALADLIDHRNGRTPYFHTPAESAYDFRLRHCQDFGVVDPDKMPYYLLIVASPTDIPFDFQYDLDAEHAVGRIHFETVEEYRNYVEKVIAYEKADQIDRERRVGFFSPTHQNDPLIQQTANQLAKPLKEKFDGQALDTMAGEKVTYQTEHKYGDAATRCELLKMLTRTTHKTSLLFTASHGLGFESGHQRQQKDQGAFICQEWPGSGSWGGATIPESMYLSGRHISEGLDLKGLIMFAFACYSAGTPKTGGLIGYSNQVPSQLAEESFIAYLPQRLLAQGALSFIGHVDRAWSYSYSWPGVGFLTATFEDTFKAILGGKPVGYALEFFNRRYLDLNNHLTNNTNGLIKKYNQEYDVEKDMVRVWTARNDARTYIVFGDPAVHLRPEIMS